MTTTTARWTPLLILLAGTGLTLPGPASAQAPEYDPARVGASALIAVGASFAALHIAFRTRSQVTADALKPRLGAALVMGAAICGMHYTGMAATEFAPGSICISTPLGVDPAWLAGMVGGGSFLVLTMTLVASVFDARLGNQNRRMAIELRSANAELQARAEALAAKMTAEAREGEARVRAIVDSALDCIIVMDAHGRVLDFNPAAERTFGYRRAEVIGTELAQKIIPPAYREQHARGMKRYLATGPADVVVLSEFGPDKRSVLANLKAAYPFQVDCADQWPCSLALLSRLPLEAAGVGRIASEGREVRASDMPAFVWAKLAGSLTVIGTHLHRPSRDPWLCRRPAYANAVARRAPRASSLVRTPVSTRRASRFSTETSAFYRRLRLNRSA